MPSFEEILRTAKKAGASDVHLTAGIPPRMRINGRLTAMEYESLTPADTLDIALHIMTEVQREQFEEQGECDMAISLGDCERYRLNVYKQKGTIAFAVRLVCTSIPTLEELGIPSSVIDLYQKKKGMVLVTGPAGNGKSTTLASLVDKINSCREAHVITLEDPIEYLHPHKKSIVNQREIGIDSVNYTNGLRAALREDPDVILVGEMRDYETIQLAITAAEMGHLILASLPTIGVVNAIERMIDVFPPYQQQQTRIQLAEVLEAVITQQLLPARDGAGRVAVFGVLHTDNEIRSLIREGRFAQIHSVMQAGQDRGMITLDDAILQKYREGRIDKECAVQYAQDADAMQKKM